MGKNLDTTVAFGICQLAENPRMMMIFISQQIYNYLNSTIGIRSEKKRGEEERSCRWWIALRDEEIKK